MKIVIPGGTGQVGEILNREILASGHDVVVLSRGGVSSARVVTWDGRTAGPWSSEIDGADVVINLAGRSVNCRYTEANLNAMMSSRVDSTRVVGLAIEKAARPPKVWLQMSTATIYAHRFDAPNDEVAGILGGQEANAPAYWRRSIDIAKAWEGAQQAANTPHTRKVALRTAMVMSPDSGGIFDVLLGLTRSTKWMVEIGAFFLRTDTELLLKSRRVVPTRLVQAGFSFDFPEWSAAAEDLVRRNQKKALTE